MISRITEVPPADSGEAHQHFYNSLRYETDCADVHSALASNRKDFVLLDVRSPELYRRGHIQGAVNVPHRKMVERYMAKWPPESVFVVYCAGPHCNGAQRAAVRLAALKRPVKVMAGGVTGWIDEGFQLVNESPNEL
jgi:rhodanese-related sulfurtransferase